jgi:hypothetical protein
VADVQMTVGPAPTRSGVWLGVDEGNTWHPLAKFRSEDAAVEFLSLLRGKRVTVNGEPE